MGTTEQLPDGWIRKESKSRPNTHYYFNVKTGKTQWEPPTDKKHKKPSKDDAKSTKSDTSSKVRDSVQGRLKISDKSKDVKKPKSKTPAQDRLQNMVARNKAVAQTVQKMIVDSTEPSKTAVPNKRKQKTESTVVLKKPNLFTGDVSERVESAKSAQPINSSDLIESARQVRTQTHTDRSLTDEIPDLFPSKTLAQDRLKSLQQKLTPVGNKRNHDAVRVFSDSFGFTSHNANQDNDDDMDVDMEWEACDNDTTYSFQQLESMVIEELTNSAYIVPDTNVFIDSLMSIKLVIEKESNFSVLIPFVVLQELDQLKRRTEQNSLRSKSSQAIKYIYEQLKAKNHRMQGQKATDDKEHIIDVTNADDKILNYCLQLKGQSKEVILLTNDINLSNKALLSGIEAITSKQCLERF